MTSFLRKNQQGMALLVAMMMLSLGSSIVLITFQSSSLDLEISRYLEYEAASQYLAESGVDKVLSWVTDPVNSPNQEFFEDFPTVPCTGSTNEDPEKNPPDLILSASSVGPSSVYFSELASMGNIEKIRFYKSKNTGNGQLCTVEVTAISGKNAMKTIKVDLIENPLGSITAGIQGQGNPNNPSPVWSHWGAVRYIGNAHVGSRIERVPDKIETIEADGNVYSNVFQFNVDPLMELHVQNSIILEPSFEGEEVSVPNEDGTFDSRPNVFQGDKNEGSVGLDAIDTERLKHFIKKHGEIHTVSPDGNLKWGNGEVKTFEEVFGGSEAFKLVWIEKEASSEVPLTIDGGKYQGYFYFTGNILIKGDEDGQDIEVDPPPKNGLSQSLVPLRNINLHGLFYVQGEIELQRKFSAYGALYAGEGFTGDHAADLEVWYNSAFAQSNYQGVRRVTPIPGTWAISSHS